MKEFLEFVGKHPVLTVIIVSMIGGTVTDVAKVIKGTNTDDTEED